MMERPVDEESIRFGTWRLLKVDYIVIGSVRTPVDGQGHELVYQLFDVHTQERLCRKSPPSAPVICAMAHIAWRMPSTKH